MTGRRTVRRAVFPWPVLFLALLVLAAGCQQNAEPTPTPGATTLPPVGVASGSGVASASGEIVPAQKADLGFATAGRVQAVLVEVGDRVQAGDVAGRARSSGAGSIRHRRTRRPLPGAGAPRRAAGRPALPGDRRRPGARRRGQGAVGAIERGRTLRRDRCGAVISRCRAERAPTALRRPARGGAHQRPGRAIQCGGCAATGAGRLRQPLMAQRHLRPAGESPAPGGDQQL